MQRGLTKWCNHPGPMTSIAKDGVIPFHSMGTIDGYSRCDVSEASVGVSASERRHLCIQSPISLLLQLISEDRQQRIDLAVYFQISLQIQHSRHRTCDDCSILLIFIYCR